MAYAIPVAYAAVGVFDPLTADTGRTRWVIGEFGAALAIVALGVAWIVLRRRADAPAAAAESVGR